MSKARCWLGFRPSTALASDHVREANIRASAYRATTRRGRATNSERKFQRISSTLSSNCQTLFRILRGDDFDLDQESGIGERGDSNDRARRKIWLRAAEELGVSVHEGLEVHRRAGVVNQKHLHLDDIAHAES